MTLTLISCAPDPQPVRIAEPPVIAIDGEDLTVWRFEDGSVVIRIGPAHQLGAATLLLEPQHIRPIAVALMGLSE